MAGKQGSILEQLCALHFSSGLVVVQLLTVSGHSHGTNDSKAAVVGSLLDK